MEFPGGGGSTARPSGTENPGGWGGQTGKTLRGGGMDIFWNHTMLKKECSSVDELNVLQGYCKLQFVSLTHFLQN